MAAKKVDPLVAGLDALDSNGSKSMPKMEVLYGDRPDVLDAVIRARRDRHLSWNAIAAYLTRNGPRISAGAVQTWCERQGLT